MKKVNHPVLRPKNSRPTGSKNNKKKRGAFLLEAFSQLYKSALGSLASKIVVGLFGATGLLGFAYERYIANPTVELFIEGEIRDFDNPDQKIPGVEVFVQGKNVLFKSDGYGKFGGMVKIRKKETKLLLNVVSDKFSCKPKSIFVPQNDNPHLITNFNLKRYGSDLATQLKPPER